MAETVKHEPSQEDMVAIAQAGGAAATADPAATPETAQAATQTAMSAEAERRNVAISDDDCNRIAAATIVQLKAMGAFDPPTPAPADSGNDGDATDAGAPTEPSGEVSPATSENPPRKLTWAEKFAGEK